MRSTRLSHTPTRDQDSKKAAHWLLELKDGSKPPSRRRLTEDEAAWHRAWGGQVGVAASVDEALALIGAVR